MNTLISIITVCLNSEKTIERTLRSVLTQSYQQYEYIILDGGSTDRTISIIQQYSKQFGDKLTCISEKDSGIYDALNKGIHHAQGSLIGIIHSDDWYEQDTFEKVIAEYNSNQSSVIYGNLNLCKDSVVVSVQNNRHETLHTQMIPHPTCFVPKKIYEVYGLFDVKYKIAADYEFMLRIFAKGVTFKKVDSTFANFSIGGVSTSLGKKGTYEYFSIREKYGYVSIYKYYLEIIKVNINYLRAKYRFHNEQ